VSERALYLSDELAAEMLGAAARAFPLECCGLIEGIRTEGGWRVTALHEAANMAEDPARRFLIDPQRQFDLMRALRSPRALRAGETRIIGCFHSHPAGPPEPSATDRAEAFEDDFLWLIAGGSADSGFTLQAYIFTEESGFARIDLHEEG
jgi:proteasome lid subunit RPN8/RPN11